MAFMFISSSSVHTYLVFSSAAAASASLVQRAAVLGWRWSHAIYKSHSLFANCFHCKHLHLPLVDTPTFPSPSSVKTFLRFLGDFFFEFSVFPFGRLNVQIKNAHENRLMETQLPSHRPVPKNRYGSTLWYFFSWYLYPIVMRIIL